MNGERPATVRIGDGVPFEVPGFTLAWERQPADGQVFTGPLPVSASLDIDFDWAALAGSWWAETTAMGAASRAQRWRLRWSGPDKLARRIARMYGIPARMLLPTPPSALDGRYRRRQRNRVKRRRR